MAQQTVVGMFDSVEDARKAVEALAAAGFSKDSYDMAARSGDMGSGSSSNMSTNVGSTDSVAGSRSDDGTGSAIGRFFSNLFGDDQDEASRYSHVASQSNSIVTVHCHSEENARQAADILDRFGTVDVNERSAQYASGSGQAATARTGNMQEGAESVKVIKEELNVGKREVETGGARLRSRIVERPVEESLRLREEHVFVNRNTVDRPATEADFSAFREGTIELKETAEVPVVQKEARVVEEVSLGKETSERTETIRDTVRSTEVEVENLGKTDVTRDSSGSSSSSSSSSTSGGL